ncbi:MAG TPA: hypothetical protein DDZ73_13770 [Gammaproteobacteria bacterium]|nr:hypothetical protein [Gammaproteobacteria bacterium]HBK77421.1 hypothetical protein [Gammaproteobacteria bacterium]
MLRGDRLKRQPSSQGSQWPLLFRWWVGSDQLGRIRSSVSHFARNGLTSTQICQSDDQVGEYVESGSAVDRFLSYLKIPEEFSIWQRK